LQPSQQPCRLPCQLVEGKVSAGRTTGSGRRRGRFYPAGLAMPPWTGRPLPSPFNSNPNQKLLLPDICNILDSLFPSSPSIHNRPRSLKVNSWSWHLMRMGTGKSKTHLISLLQNVWIIMIRLSWWMTNDNDND
jgi:hypothetical protein